MRPPVVLVHGAFCGSWALEPMRWVFEARGHQAYCPTLRHHQPESRSRIPPELGQTSLLHYCKDLEEDILAGLDEPPILVGHSMGGLICQMLAARNRVRALCLLAPSPPWGVLPSTTLEVMSAQGLFLVAGQFWKQALVPNFSLAAEHTLDRLSPAAQREVFSRFVPESGRAMFEILHWPADTQRASAVNTNRVACPVLCVTGSKDKVNPSGTVRRIAARYELGTFYELKGFSHWLIGEPGWEDVVGVCMDWLDSMGLARA
ncbi:MAG: alpha/beta hydrolase [Alphaproteobacteria bacterium]